MSVKSISIILTFTFLATFAGAMKNKKDLLYMLSEDLNDQSALQSLKEFADEIFQLENSTDDLYEFVHYFLTVNLEEISPYGGMTEQEQLEKLQNEISQEIKKYFAEQSEKKEFNFIEDRFMTVFNRVRDTYERYFLAIIGKKIRLQDTEIQLPFEFARALFSEVKNLKDDENFKEVYGKDYIKKLNEYIQFINQNQKIFQDEYDIYLHIYIKYALLRSNHYNEFSNQIDELFEKASYSMNQQNREAYTNRIHGMVSVFLRLNPSEDAVTQHFRNKDTDDGSDVEDNRSDNEMKRDYKDTLILRLQTMRIESMESDDLKRQQNLSYITEATIKAFVDQQDSSHLFFLMRQMALQYIAIPSEQSAQVAIIRRLYEKEEHDWQRIKQEADQLKEDEVHPEVLFLADVLTLPIFDKEERTKGVIPEAFQLLYRNILAIPQRVIRGNAVLLVLGHYSIARPNEEKTYYQKFYQLLQKFRLQNNFNLDLLENHIQSTIALNFFIDQQYAFEKEVNSDQNLIQNYFKFKTTIVLHMLAFLDKSQVKPEEVEELKKMYQITYKEATEEELQELDEYEFSIQRPGNLTTDLFDILQHFANHWESGVEFTKDVEGLKKFSQNTFNVYDISGGDMKDRIRISISESQGSTFKFPVDIAMNFKIGLYGADALHFKAQEENTNMTAGEKEWKKKNSMRQSSSDEQTGPKLIYRKKKNVNNASQSQEPSQNDQSDESPNQNQRDQDPNARRQSFVETSEEDPLKNKTDINIKVKNRSHSLDDSSEDGELKNRTEQNIRLNNRSHSFVETSEEDPLRNQNDTDKKGGKIELDTSSEDEQVNNVESFESDNRSFSDMEGDREDFLKKQKEKDGQGINKNLKRQASQRNTESNESDNRSISDMDEDREEFLRKQKERDAQGVNKDLKRQQLQRNIESIESESRSISDMEDDREKTLNTDDQPNTLQRQDNRIRDDKVNLRLNKVKFISGQPLNQKEEEFLQDPQLLKKLADMKKQNKKISFDNDDGSVTEVVYLQIIPYGSDCFRSYQDIFVKK